MQTSDYITIVVYLLFLVGVGCAIGRLSRTSSDFVRGGGNATWWLVGSSSLLAGISAFTFTGNASGAFEAGPTLLTIYLANISAFVVQAIWLAPWFRQTRAYTPADVLRARFGPEVEQFKSYYGIIFGLFNGAIPLWALAVFSSSVFDLPMATTIIVLGIVVTVYSMTGGKWAVMGSDFVQSLIMYPITILVAWSCLRAVGGVDGFIGLFSRPDLADDFAFVKPAGSFSGDRFTWKWIIMVFVIQLSGQLNLLSAGRYLAARDGKEASRAAWLCAVGMTFGAIIWFIPPMVARGLWADEVLAMSVGQAGGGAYALAAMKVLPNGLMGIMIVAMFSATLSSMDTALNANAGMVIRNIVPPLMRLSGRKQLSDGQSLWLGRLATLALGTMVTILALWYASLDGIGLFDAFLIVGSIIGLPFSIPLLAGLFLRNMPRWSFFVVFSVGMMPSVWSLFDAKVFGNEWTYVDRSLWVLIFGAVATFCCLPAYRYAPESYRNQVIRFFECMRTPLSEEELGEGNDHIQARILGYSTIIMGGFILFLLMLPNDWAGRLSIFSIAFSVILIGGVLVYAGKRSARAKQPKETELFPEESVIRLKS